MVSFDELAKYLAFYVFDSKGKLILTQDFRKDSKSSFPQKAVSKLMLSAQDISKTMESHSEGQILTVDLTEIKIVGIMRDLLFVLITSTTASELDVEFKLRTLMSLFLGAFSQKITKTTKKLTITKADLEPFNEQLETVMTGESRYMGSSMKKTISGKLKTWIASSEGVRGIAVTSFTGAVIVNFISEELLPSAVKSISGAFSALLQGPKFFLTVAADTNLFVHILGEGLLLLVDGDPAVPPQELIPEIEENTIKLRDIMLI